MGRCVKNEEREERSEEIKTEETHQHETKFAFTHILRGKNHYIERHAKQKLLYSVCLK